MVSSITETKKQKIQVTKDGPYLVFGDIPLFPMTIKCDDVSTTPVEWVKGKTLKIPEIYSLCRCGQSKNKPFCDNTHIEINFNGAETSKQSYQNQGKIYEGPALKLIDIEILCASARFCHRRGDIWDQVPKSDDPKLKKIAVENTCDCPSGRLIITDKVTGETVEPKLEKSIAMVLDPKIGVNGPLWVRGGIPVYSSNGQLYEVRNRVTMCRCGKSGNKPFCDSSHYPEEYREVSGDKK